MSDQSLTEEQQRAQREADIYDGGQLKRERLDKMLLAAALGPARARRDAVARMAATRHVNDKVLEIGSQAWTSMFIKNKLSPTQLTCINISQRELDIGAAQARKLGLDIDFQVMDAHHLAFPDNSFDFVFGEAILHHLDFELAVREIARVLRPGGTVLFIEPLLLNPMARLVRWATPKARTPDELPLSRRELAILDTWFSPSHAYTDLFHLPAAVLSGLLGVNANNTVTRAADRLDAWIAGTWPSLGAYYRTITIHGHRRS